MLANGQTLRHKERNELARLDPTPGERWAWDISKKTAFIAEDGSKFTDDIANWTHVEDELGRPYFNLPGEGQFVDESAKKYFVSKEELSRMRQEKLEGWEAAVLDRMAGNVRTYKVTVNGKVETHTSDSAKKLVHCPFADGSKSFLFHHYFLKRRKAVPLYKVWNSFKKEYVDGPMIFRHTDGQLWIYEGHMAADLKVIEEGSIEVP